MIFQRWASSNIPGMLGSMIFCFISLRTAHPSRISCMRAVDARKRLDKLDVRNYSAYFELPPIPAFKVSYRTARLSSSGTSQSHRNPPGYRRACSLNRRSRAFERRKPLARVRVDPLLVSLESKVSTPHCPWTLRSLVLAKPPVEVPKEVDDLGC